MFMAQMLIPGSDPLQDRLLASAAPHELAVFIDTTCLRLALTELHVLSVCVFIGCDLLIRRGS